MAHPQRQAAFTSWQAPGHELEVVYSEVVLHEIVVQALDGLHALPGSGLEAGGVLFGTADESEVRITAARELACSHALGANFILNEADESRLDRLLTYYKEDPLLGGLAPVGFYVSRTRRALSLFESDIALLQKYFPLAQQLVLAVKVERGRAARAGIFLREPDGSLIAGRSHKEFEAAPASESGLRVMSKAEREAVLPARPVPAAIASGEADAAPAGAQPGLAETGLHGPAGAAATGAWTAPEEVLNRPARGPLPWKEAAIAIACMALLGSFLFYMRGGWGTAPRQSVGLRLLERNGFLLALWDSEAKPMQGRTTGALEVYDGQPRRYMLNQSLLQDGQWRIITTAGNVMVKLRLGGKGEFVETARYVAPGASLHTAGAPAAGDALSTEWQTRLDDKQRRLQEFIEANNTLDAQREAMLALVRQQLDSTAPEAAEQPRPQVRLPEAGQVPVQQTLPAPPQAAVSSAAPTGVLPLGLQSQGLRPPSAPPPSDSLAPSFADRTPATTPAAPAQAPAQTPAAAPARSGRIIWTGRLAPGGTVLITGRQATTGTVTGAVPAQPVRIGVYPAELGPQGFIAYSSHARHSRGAAEPAGAGNGWQPTTFAYDPKRARNVVVAQPPSSSNGWQRILLRAGSQPVTAILIDWELVQ
ncbi:MAG: hypothetical protein IT164_18070 [Bryobacterales bacterium]|nr:hypothetical protein [Bryobacterales bacterium]